jgi:chromosomal replication initiation ATPase DnaA
MDQQHGSFDLCDHTVDLVAEAYGISTERLTSPGRDSLLVEARAVTIQILADHGFGPSRIARHLRRDHSTVWHHLGRMRDRGHTPEEREMLADVRAALAQHAVPALRGGAR